MEEIQVKRTVLIGRGRKMRNKKDEAMKEARGSMALSGFQVTKKHDKLVSKRLKNEISEEEFLQEIRKRLEIKREE
jgi:hypothetical protein